MFMILASLMIPVVIGSMLFDLFDRDNDDTSSEKEDSSSDTGGDDAPENGFELVFDGSETLTGTSGNDTLAPSDEANLAPRQIDLLGGDDEAIIDVHSDFDVYGGEGNDTLSALSAVEMNLYGGDGDDTLYGVDSTSMYGGDGNDSITYDSDVSLNSTTARIDGGDGDDEITIFADAGFDTYDRGGAIVTGGEGSDIFSVVLDLQNSQDDILATTVCSIIDFDPSEDVLLIEIDPLSEAADRDVEITFEQSEEEDGSFESTILLTFAPNDVADEATARVTVYSETSFNLDDIQVVSATS